MGADETVRCLECGEEQKTDSRVCDHCSFPLPDPAGGGREEPAAGASASGGRDEVLLRARFSPKLKTVWILRGVVVSIVTVAGIAFLPFWLLGLGQYIARRRYDAMQAYLTRRSLVIRRGVLTRVERTIPLDKIQDMTLTQGIILRWFGLQSIALETAGSSGPMGGGTGSDGDLPAVEDAEAFRDAVLRQRDRIADREDDRPAEGRGTGPAASEELLGLLGEIRDSLGRIEEALHKPSDG